MFLGGTRIARRDSSSNVYYYFGDHLDSARVVTNSSGTVLDDCDYFPYGMLINSSCVTSGNHYLFTGKERDTVDEGGDDNSAARYYMSAYFRFINPDPSGGHFVDPQSLNRYTYVHNNPLAMIDPTGLDCIYAPTDDDDGDTVTVQRGDCSSDTDNGIYVNGTIDVNSLSVTQSANGNSLNYNFVGDNGDEIGQQFIGSATPSYVSLLQPGDSSGFNNPGTGQLNSFAQGVFSQVYNNTRAVTNPSNIAGFYGASALDQMTPLPGAGLVSASGIPTSIVEGIAPEPILESLQQASLSLAENPAFTSILEDIAQGYTPGAVPATWAGVTGLGLSEIVSHWSTISNYVRSSVPH